MAGAKGNLMLVIWRTDLHAHGLGFSVFIKCIWSLDHTRPLHFFTSLLHFKSHAHATLQRMLRGSLTSTARLVTRQSPTRLPTFSSMFRNNPVLRVQSRAHINTKGPHLREKWWQMHIADFAKAYPFLFKCWCVFTIGQVYLIVTAFRDLREEFRKLQKARQDSKRMKEILHEIYEDSRIPVDAYETVKPKKWGAWWVGLYGKA